MKKLAFTLLLGCTLFASDIELATKIYKTIASALTSKSAPTFYLHGEIPELRNNPNISCTERCETADIVIVSTLKELPAACKEKILFATRYKLFKRNPNIVGAFFWQKGRPNIIFGKRRLEAGAITLGPEFSDYIE